MTIQLLTNTITVIFFVVILSYYVLLFIKRKSAIAEKKFNSISIIIPAHNEEKYIADCLASVIDARFDGDKEIIVVDDGSKDKTSEIVARFKVTLLKTEHTGKSNAINKALALAKGDLIAVVDADSVIHKDSLTELTKEVEKKNVVAACCPVKVKNRKKFICLWLHIGEIYYSLMRNIFSKVNANITTPGPLSVYRKKELLEIGGFSTDCFSEDADVTIRLIRKGYTIGFSEKAMAETNMPYDAKGFFRQRTRFARGLIKLLKKHLQLNNSIIDLYTLPLFLFGYVQSLIMGSWLVYQIISGYTTYFYSKGIYFNWLVLKFFFEWFSLVGTIKWMITVFQGQTPLTFITIAGILATLLSYPLYLIAILKYDKKIDLWHLIPLFFMFPFWLLMMMIQIICIPEYFKKEQYNKWKKNE
ncbi:glycosyltransferase family 2 protein [Candidatus Woesearchaeota archaeon]|nr:glycosyltransferase family 2 protein [Candidatus Woesearchaeota archaeon]